MTHTDTSDWPFPMGPCFVNTLRAGIRPPGVISGMDMRATFRCKKCGAWHGGMDKDLCPDCKAKEKKS